MTLLTISLWSFSKVSVSTSITTFVFLYTFVMIAIAMIIMPAQTNGLNQLPTKYYSHGTAIISTLQQIAGAIGVAFYVSIMALGQKLFFNESSSSRLAMTHVDAIVSGIQFVFQVSSYIAMIGLILSLFIKRAKVILD